VKVADPGLLRRPADVQNVFRRCSGFNTLLIVLKNVLIWIIFGIIEDTIVAVLRDRVHN